MTNLTTSRSHLCQYKKIPCGQHLIQRREVNTTAETKNTTVLENEEALETDNTKNFSDNTKEEDSENSYKKTERYFKYGQKKL